MGNLPFNLFPHLTTIKNIIPAPIVVKKMNKVEAYEMGRRLLEKVGLLE